MEIVSNTVTTITLKLTDERDINTLVRVLEIARDNTAHPTCMEFCERMLAALEEEGY